MASISSYIAEARSDAADRLIEAAEPLASMQLHCGGEIPGTIASPALLELVRKARSYGLRLARAIEVQDETHLINAFVEVVPEEGGQGCRIGLAHWETAPLPKEEFAEADDRRADIDRQLAELTALLDPAQNVLSVECRSEELADIAGAMGAGAGHRWTDSVELIGDHAGRSHHWRLLDGAPVRVAQSQRDWKVRLVPIGAREPGSKGFELLLVADQPAPEPVKLPIKGEAERISASLGREIAPVLRQPISRIIANAETIRTQLAGPLSDQYSAYAADIASAGEHLLSLLDDLADLEVIESADFSTAPDQIDVADVARRAAGILGVRAQEKQIRLVAPGVEEALPAVAEFRRVLQVLLNLVGNAIRYSPEGSEIRLVLEDAGDKVRVTVADEGDGLSEEQQAKVFEKFERLGRTGSGGTGLGLYISRRLARAMGGELTVASKPGEGARFTLELPADV